MTPWPVDEDDEPSGPIESLVSAARVVLSNDPETAEAARVVDAGLLLVPGIGIHARTSVLVDVVEPLLARLARSDQLVGVSALQLGDSSAPGGTYDGLLVEYRARAQCDSTVKRLLAVEGRWEGVFAASPLKTVSSWSARNASKMMWELSVYIARGWRWVGSLAVVALLVAGVALSAQEEIASLLVLASAFVATSIVAGADVLPAILESRPSARRILLALTSAGTLVVYEAQRGFVLLVTLTGIVLLPVGAVVTRWVSSLPFLGALGLGMIQGFERSLLSGGIADMEAVASNHVATAAIQDRIRGALEEIESRVRPGGTVTLVGHSGGAPLAWRALSEPQIVERPASREIRYRLITVGAALNWALHGFSSLATPLSAPLVNNQRPSADRTFWLNAFTAWDPAPHGPVAPSDLHGWQAWDDGPLGPNRQMTNLGSPLSTEHSEYFRNQQEFVPTLLRAIDPDVVWAQRDAGGRHHLLSNLRLALVSPLVRLRLIVVALPIAAVVSVVRGHKLICAAQSGSVYASIANAVGRAISSALSAAHLSGPEDAVCSNRGLQALVVAGVLALAANALMDVYTNYFWQSLGRVERDLTPGPDSGFVVPLGSIVMLWVPSFVVPVVVLAPFDLGAAYWVLAGLTCALAVLEIVWLNECLLALKDPGRSDRYNVAIGRRRDGLSHTPAAYSSRGSWPGLRKPRVRDSH